MKENVQRLKSEFVVRANANPRYSLRAFARHLEVSPSLLCEVLGGKRNFSSKTMEKIESKLGWQALRKTERKPASEIKSLTWLHLAILELAEDAKLKNDHQNIGATFGLPVKSIAFAIETLQKHGLLSIENGILKPIPNRLFFGSDTPSQEIRRFHKEFIQTGLQKIDTTLYEERELSSSIISLSKAQVQELRTRIRATVEEFCKFSRKKANDKEVYGFSIQLFKLTEKFTEKLEDIAPKTTEKTDEKITQKANKKLSERKNKEKLK